MLEGTFTENLKHTVWGSTACTIQHAQGGKKSNCAICWYLVLLVSFKLTLLSEEEDLLGESEVHNMGG